MGELMHCQQQKLTIPIVVFALIVSIFIYSTDQLLHPFISHDDWDFLAPASWGLAYSTPWDKTLTEGRWLSYLWSQVSTHFSPKSSYLLFLVSYFSLVCATTLSTARPRTFVLCGLAIFFSPMLGELSLWPTGMSCSVIICGLATWTILRLDERFATSIVFAATLLLVLTYPPLASVVLLTAAIKKANASVRGKIHLGASYIAGFAVGSILIFILNLIFHSYFGVKVDSWRNPRPLHDFNDLIANAKLYGQHLTQLTRAYPLAVICGGLAAIILLRKESTRNKAISILPAAALLGGIELGITLVTGTGTPIRSSMWLWLTTCLLCALVAEQSPLSFRSTGSILLIVLIVAGGSSWWQLYRQKQPAATYEANLAAWIQQYQAMTDISAVTVVGNPRRVASLRALNEKDPMPAFKMSMLKRYGIKIEECSMEFCSAVRDYLQSHNMQASPLIVVDGKLALVFDRNGKAGYYERNYPSAEGESSLGLNYPLFLPYGAEAVRLTPFYPGTSKLPVSIKLAPSIHGYAIHFGGATCTFPVEYQLTRTTGEKMAGGINRSPAQLDLPGWDTHSGVGIFSIYMAKDAPNNFGCNVVITKK